MLLPFISVNVLWEMERVLSDHRNRLRQSDFARPVHRRLGRKEPVEIVPKHRREVRFREPENRGVQYALHFMAMDAGIDPVSIR